MTGITPEVVRQWAIKLVVDNDEWHELMKAKSWRLVIASGSWTRRGDESGLGDGVISLRAVAYRERGDVGQWNSPTE